LQIGPFASPDTFLAVAMHAAFRREELGATILRCGRCRNAGNPGTRTGKRNAESGPENQES
jgi:hypothetical protein